MLDEALFEECENVYSKLIRLEPGDAMSEVIRVFDLGESGAILYSEVGSQKCFLAKV